MRVAASQRWSSGAASTSLGWPGWRTRRARGGPRRVLTQAGPRVDRPEDPRPARRGPVDLADHRCPRPAAPRPPAGRGPAPPLGTSAPPGQARPEPRPPRVPEHPRDGGPARRCTETRQARPRQAARVEEPPPRTPPRRGRNNQKRPHTQGTTRTRRLRRQDEVVCEILAATVTPPPESLRADWLRRAKPAMWASG